MRKMKTLLMIALAFGLFFASIPSAYALAVIRDYNTPVDLVVQPGETRPVMFLPGTHPRAVIATVTQIDGFLNGNLAGEYFLLRNAREQIKMGNFLPIPTQTIAFSYYNNDPTFTDLIFLRTTATKGPITVRLTFRPSID
jgi:hypothetical protein